MNLNAQETNPHSQYRMTAEENADCYLLRGALDQPKIAISAFKKKNKHRPDWKLTDEQIEQRWGLVTFWREYPHLDAAGKLRLLQTYAEKGSKISPKQLKHLRYKWDKFKNRKALLVSGKCSLCDKTADVRHHIVQLKNRGPNHRLNLTPLCHSCHSQVHPWMR